MIRTTGVGEGPLRGVFFKGVQFSNSQAFFHARFNTICSTITLFASGLSLLLATGTLAITVEDGDDGFVETGGDLVVTINSECDFTSIKYQGA
ncbi:hypothetical protein BJX70DRAFT_394168 [Aspergillus crustosus]